MITLEELSQIVEVVEISPSQEEHILATAKNLSISPEILEGPKFPELQKDSPCQSAKEAEKLGTTPNKYRSLRPKTKEFSACISTNPSYTKEINHPKE